MRRETTALVTVTMALTLVGVLMVYSTSAVRTDGFGMMMHHFAYVGAGLAAMLAASRFDYHRLRDAKVYRLLVVGTIVLLLAVLAFGRNVDGGQRWLGVGALRFQPSEFAKFALIVLLAVKLTQNREYVHEFRRGFLPPVLMACFFAALVLGERDLGVPVVLMAVAFMMMCIAGVRWRYLIASIAPGATALVAAIVLAPHRMHRISSFLDPWADRKGASFQLIQSLAAFAHGGVLGRGAGASEQKLYYLPAAHTDFIFAVVGEELGLIGTIAVVVLYLALLFLTFRIAMNASDHFGALLASGIGCLILFQATFIMMVTAGMLPTKGLPLPFISYGGTALIVMLGLVGVLVSIGVQAQPPQPLRKPHPALAHARGV